MSLEEFDDFEPLPYAQRMLVGPDPSFTALLAQSGLVGAQYRGTDMRTGDEYWYLQPIGFVVRPSTRQMVVWHIGADPDHT